MTDFNRLFVVCTTFAVAYLVLTFICSVFIECFNHNRKLSSMFFALLIVLSVYHSYLPPNVRLLFEQQFNSTIKT
jgi:hypothetical protein